MSSEIIKVLEYISSKFGIVVDWSQDTMMPYIQELTEKIIAYEIATSYAWIGIGVIMFLLGVILCYMDTLMYADGLLFSFGFVLGLAACIMIATQVFDIVTAQTFPEKMILEYIQTFLQNK